MLVARNNPEPSIAHCCACAAEMFNMLSPIPTSSGTSIDDEKKGGDQTIHGSELFGVDSCICWLECTRYRPALRHICKPRHAKGDSGKECAWTPGQTVRVEDEIDSEPPA